MRVIWCLTLLWGSGTTGKMALLNKRRFIGVELVKNYYDISVKRIEEIVG